MKEVRGGRVKLTLPPKEKLPSKSPALLGLMLNTYNDTLKRSPFSRAGLTT